MYYWNIPLLILFCILHPILSNGNLVDGREYSCKRSFRLFHPETRYYERRDTRLNMFSPKNHVTREHNRDLSILERSREERNSRMTERHFEATRQVRIDEDQIKSSRILNRGLSLSQDRARTNFPQVRSENSHYTRLMRARQTEVFLAERYESNVIKRIDKTQIRTLLRSRSADNIESVPRRGETTVRLRSLHLPAEWNINEARRQPRKIGRENTRRTRELLSDRDQVREESHFLDRQERLYSPETRRVIGKRNIILENITNNRITDQSSKKPRDEIRVSRTKGMRIQSNSEKKSFMRVDIIRETETRDTETRSMRNSINRINEMNMRNSNSVEYRVHQTIREREESQKQIANRDRRIDVRKETRSNSIEARYFNVRRDMRNANQFGRRNGNERQHSRNNVREDTSLKYSEGIIFGDNKESIKRFKFNMGRDNLQNCNMESRCDVRSKQRSINGEHEDYILRTSGGMSVRDSREFNMERDVSRNGDSRLNSRDVHLKVSQRLISVFPNQVHSRLNTRNANGIQRSVNHARQDTFLKSSERLSVNDNRDSAERVRKNIERHVAVRQYVRNADLRLNTHNVQSGKQHLINEVRQDQLLRFERINFRDNRVFSQRVRMNIERNALMKQNKRNRSTQNISRDIRLNVRERLTNEDLERSLSGSSERISFRDNRESIKKIRNNMERDVALRRNGHSKIPNAELLTHLTTEAREGYLRLFGSNSFINSRKSSERVRINVQRDVDVRSVIRNDRTKRHAHSSKRFENKIREDSFSIFGRADIRDNRLSVDRIRYNLERSYSEKQFLRNRYMQSSRCGVSVNVKQCQFNEMQDIPNLISGKGAVQNNRVSTDRNWRNVESGFVERRDVRNDNTQAIERRNFKVKQRGSRDGLDSSMRTKNSRNILREYNTSVRNPSNMTHKNKTEYDLFNWQALFYTLQGIYICSIVFRTMHKNEFTKKKTWSCAWLFIPDTKIN